MTERILFEYLLNSVWQVPMLAAMAWLLIWLSRPGARVQHAVWLGTLALAVLLPLRGIDVSVPAQPQVELSATTQTIGIATAGGNLLEAAAQPTLASTIASPKPQRVTWVQAVRWLATRRVRLSESVADWLLALYFLVVVFRLFQLGCAWRAARQLVAYARPATFSQPERAMLQRLCDGLGVAQPEILMSGEIVSPLTMGGMRPVLVLPESFHEISAMEMTAMLCHELVHVRRRDYWMNFVCQAGALPIVYHPATYAVQRRVRQTREMVCDATTADTMQSASGYARCLLALAERMLDGRDCAEQMQAVGLFDNNKLEERIMRLLETKTRMSVRARIVRTAAGTILMMAGIAAATVLHVTPTVVHAAISPTLAMQAAIPQAAATGTATASQGVSQPPADSTQAAPPQTDPAQSAAPTSAAAPQADGTAAAAPTSTTEPTPAPAPQENAAPNPGPAPQVNPQPVPPADVQPVPQVDVQPVPPSAPDVAPVPPSAPVPPDASPNETRSRVERREERRSERRTDERNDLTPEQRAQLESQLAAVREQMRSEMKVFRSPEFKQQMDAARQQFRAAMQKQRDVERQRWTQLKESPEFKQQMDAARQQMDAAREKIRTAARQQRERTGNATDTATFKQQMAEAQQQMAIAVQKLQSAQMQRQMQLKQNPEFEQQMEAARQQFQSAMQKLQSDAMQRQLQVTQSPEFKEQIQKMVEIQRQLHGDRSGDAAQHP